MGRKNQHPEIVGYILLAGLVGLMLGLFIGWWVWPTQWSAAPSAATPAPQTLQTPQTPEIADEDTALTYARYFDWANRGLLILAAALLLTGGVVIGYQLLRQSRKSPPAESENGAPHQPMLNFPPRAKRRSGPTAEPGSGAPHPQIWRSIKLLLSDKQAAQTRQQPLSPRLDEDEREPISYDDVVEPVFPAQSTTGSVPLRNQSAESQSGPPHPDRAESSSGPSSDTQSNAPGAEYLRSVSHGPTAAPEFSERETSFAEPEETEWRTDADAPDLAREPRQDPDERASQLSGVMRPFGNDHTASEGASEWIGDRDVASALEAGPGLAPAQEDDLAADRWTEPSVVGTFEVNYAFGIQSYDESFTINSADNELLGACGMGVNESLDRAAADTDQVRLLDIWLYDRSAVRSISQTLISPGFDMTDWDERTDNAGAVAGAPLEVSSGLTCTLRSKQIALECTVSEVTFLDTETAPRPFRSLKARLVARSRQ